MMYEMNCSEKEHSLIRTTENLLCCVSVQISQGGHSITKHTGGLARRSESKTSKYLSKNSNFRKMLKSYPYS